MIEAIELTSTRRSRGARGGPVEKVSFDVYPGQVTALLGAPGTGKSTVLRLMVELEPGAGRTLFGGRPFRALRPAIREVGLALNPDAVHPGRTVQAHLQLYSAAGGVPKGRIAEVLEVAGLSAHATVRCGGLDPGQRQRLSIAAALLGDPSALILDEPRALDSHGMSWFHALIRAYATQGRTVLVAATDPDSLSGTADHVVILRRDEHDGVSRVIASRSAAEVFDERRVTVVQVRSPQAARLAAALESEGARLSPAGPGALQVQGLDRARIGEVAHVAGICLHELSEIVHDEDVFGLRPLPRQKELLPSLNRAEAAWHRDVRLVTEEIEEAEVVEAAAEAIEHPVTASVGAQTEAAGAPLASGGAMSANVGNQPAEAAPPVAETSLSQGTIASPRESTATASGPENLAVQPDAKARWRSQSSQWWAVKSVADQPPQGSADQGSGSGAVSPAQRTSSFSTSPEQASVLSQLVSPVGERDASLSATEPASISSTSVSTASERAASWTTLADAQPSSSSGPISTAAEPVFAGSVSTASERASSWTTLADVQPSSFSGPISTATGSDSISSFSTASERASSWTTLADAQPSSSSGPISTATGSDSISSFSTATERVSSSSSPLSPPTESDSISSASPATERSTGLSTPTDAETLSSSYSAPIERPASVPQPDSTAAERASTSAAPTSPSVDSIDSAAPAESTEAPIVVRTVEAPALRRPSSFGLRMRGREKPPAPHAETAARLTQPAVPFTVAAPTEERGAAADGMTPWRAVTVRAAQQNQQQVSVAEAAPAEQETSA